MSEKTTTSNGFEIQHPAEKMTPEGLRSLLSNEFYLDGETPRDRVEQLKELSQEGVAIMLESINSGLQGSRDSLMRHEGAMRIGDKKTLDPSDRYDVFTSLINAIRSAPDSVNPARIGDTLALGTTLLHPFEDGNGRTARIVGMMFRDDFNPDAPDFDDAFHTLAASRDEIRGRNGFVVNGYVPQFEVGVDQSDPREVTKYLKDLLENEGDDVYTGPYGKAPLYDG